MERVYHEKQEAALCGCHAVNNLVQTKAFTEAELADIAAELDDAERALMFSNGMDTSDAIRYIAEGSTNVDDSGNFSITVLREALHRAYGLELSAEDADVESALADPSGQKAFVLNLGAHWFSIRKLHGVWLNLNSMLKGPEIISEFYLAAFLAQMRTQGYYIFVVKGSLPAPCLDGVTFPSSFVHTMADVRSGKGTREAEEARKKGKRQAMASATEDPEFAAALAASLADSSSGVPRYGGAGHGVGVGHPGAQAYGAGAGAGELDEEEQLRAAIAASLGEGQSAGNDSKSNSQLAVGLGLGKRSRDFISVSPPSGLVAGAGAIDVEDEELRMALSLSMQQQGQAVPSYESASAAAARLLATVPPDPTGTAEEVGSARISIRFPSVSPVDTSAPGADKAAAVGIRATPSAPPPAHRRFRADSPVRDVLAWAVGQWLAHWAEPQGQGEGQGASGAAAEDAATGEGERKPFPVLRHTLLVGGLPRRTLDPEAETDAKVSVRDAGLVPSAALTILVGLPLGASGGMALSASGSGAAGSAGAPPQ